MLAIRVDKRPISQMQLALAIAQILTVVFVGGGLWYKYSNLATDAASKADFAALTAKVENQGAARQTRDALLDRNIDDMQQQLKPLATIELRLDQNEKRDDAQDARLDKILELVSNKLDLFGGKFDTLNETVSGVKADVRVIGQDLKNLATKASPTAFKP